MSQLASRASVPIDTLLRLLLRTRWLAGPAARLLAKVLLGMLVLVNLRSFPLAWHFRVFFPLFGIRARGLLLRLRTCLQPRAARQRAEAAFLEALCPVGAHPLDFGTTYTSWASPDDCDFNGHLSNSSYAKVLDMARFKLATASFPLFFHYGGWMALAGTSYAFLREIPRLARYEVRLSVVAWDAKWLYLAARFVTHAKPTPRARPDDPEPAPRTLFPLRTPASGLATPLPSTAPGADAAALAAGLGRLRAEPDGATLHCVAVSQCCFKHGRLTVPPAVVLGSHGFTAAPGHSRARPPSHWSQAVAVLGTRGAGDGTYAAFVRGGWREGARWWEDALAGVEERRRANLEALDGVRAGMEAAAGF